MPVEKKHWLRSLLEAAAVPITTTVILVILGFGVRVALATLTIEAIQAKDELQDMRIVDLEYQSHAYSGKLVALERDIEQMRAQQREGFQDLKQAINQNREIILDEVRRRNP